MQVATIAIHIELQDAVTLVVQARVMSGTASEVREQIEAWYDTGLNTLIIVPLSARGNQMVAFEEIITALR